MKNKGANLDYKEQFQNLTQEEKENMYNTQKFFEIINNLQSNFFPESLNEPINIIIELNDVSIKITSFHETDIINHEVIGYLLNGLRCFESTQILHLLLDTLTNVVTKTENSLYIIQDQDILELIQNLLSLSDVELSCHAIDFLNSVIFAKIGETSKPKGNFFQGDEKDTFIQYLQTSNIFEFCLSLSLEVSNETKIDSNIPLQKLIISILKFLASLSYFLNNPPLNLMSKLVRLVERAIVLPPCTGDISRIILFLLYTSNPSYDNSNSSELNMKKTLISAIRTLVVQILNPLYIQARSTLVKVLSKLSTSQDEEFYAIPLEMPPSILTELIKESCTKKYESQEEITNVLLLASNLCGFGSEWVSVIAENSETFGYVCQAASEGTAMVKDQALWLLWSMILAGTVKHYKIILASPIFEIMFDAFDLDDKDFINMALNHGVYPLIDQIFKRNLQNLPPFDSALQIIFSNLSDRDFPIPIELQTKERL